ncbi:hypothetical protein F5Y17DRAFT_55542 [Xylariaceae sp. FL0594]|nr:hypothetical protein F5Y17DRAFT_55542 [Xylariaceae sp. FL0594]
MNCCCCFISLGRPVQRTQHLVDFIIAHFCSWASSPCIIALLLRQTMISLDTLPCPQNGSSHVYHLLRLLRRWNLIRHSLISPVDEAHLDARKSKIMICRLILTGVNHMRSLDTSFATPSGKQGIPKLIFSNTAARLLRFDRSSIGHLQCSVSLV